MKATKKTLTKTTATKKNRKNSMKKKNSMKENGNVIDLHFFNPLIAVSREKMISAMSIDPNRMRNK